MIKIQKYEVLIATVAYVSKGMPKYLIFLYRNHEEAPHTFCLLKSFLKVAVILYGVSFGNRVLFTDKIFLRVSV